MNISVYVPSYNQRHELREAIESVLAQTLPPQQLILVDDASSDGSREVVLGYRSRYPSLVTAVLHDRNLGVAATRRDALERAKGDYVTYVDGDDWFLPTKLEREAAALTADPSARIAYSNTEYIGASGETLWRWIERDPPPTGDVLIETLARLYPKRSIFRMELVDVQLLRDVGFHRTDLPVFEDFELRIRLTARARTVYVDEVLSRVRDHERGLSRTALARQLDALDTIFTDSWPLIRERGPWAERAARRGVSTWLAPHLARAEAEARDGAHADALQRLRTIRNRWVGRQDTWTSTLAQSLPRSLRSWIHRSLRRDGRA